MGVVSRLEGGVQVEHDLLEWRRHVVDGSVVEDYGELLVRSHIFLKLVVQTV